MCQELYDEDFVVIDIECVWFSSESSSLTYTKSDKTKILGNNNKIYVRRKPDERLLPECLGEFGDRELTFCYVLGVHLIPWRIKPSPVERNMNTDKYVSNFDDHLCYMVAQHFTNRHGSLRRTTHLVICLPEPMP